MLSIRLPVSGQMQIAILPKKRHQVAHKRRLDQASFVVPFFMPGIRKKNVDAINGVWRQAVRHDLYGVICKDAKIRDLCRHHLSE